ncbi:MAG: flavodoxin family protein [Eubacterium sp.]|nr:flavodoxin family protein [Eubacterium sp.]
MNKNVLVISTSLRNGGNSQALAKHFADGASKADNSVEMISLVDKTINFCRGCLACQKLQKCVIRDDSNEIVEKMKNADVICFATPIYYYEMSGQMKTLLDRANPLYASDYKFREVYFLSSAAEDEEDVDKKALNGLQGWIDCFEKAELKGTVFAGGVTDIGDIKEHGSLDSAFELGKRI